MLSATKTNLDLGIRKYVVTSREINHTERLNSFSTYGIVRNEIGAISFNRRRKLVVFIFSYCGKYE
jgi:hypothetical protein